VAQDLDLSAYYQTSLKPILTSNHLKQNSSATYYLLIYTN